MQQPKLKTATVETTAVFDDCGYFKIPEGTTHVKVELDNYGLDVIVTFTKETTITDPHQQKIEQAEYEKRLQQYQQQLKAVTLQREREKLILIEQAKYKAAFLED